MMFATLDKVKDETTGKMRERTKVGPAPPPRRRRAGPPQRARAPAPSPCPSPKALSCCYGRRAT